MRLKKPTPSSTDHTATAQAWLTEACSSMNLPMNPGSGGSPAIDAASTSITSPSKAGWATGALDSRRPAMAPRCPAIISAHKNKPATTSVEFAR